MVGYHRRAVKDDIDIETMRQMRYNGMTNKQIADTCGCSVSTVYSYLGKKSRDVQHCIEQNKPAPIADVPQVSIDETSMVAELVIEIEPPKPILKTIKEVRILDLEGLLCNYHVNQMTGDVEMVDGTVTGLLDKSLLTRFIEELQEVAKLLEVS